MAFIGIKMAFIGILTTYNQFLVDFGVGTESAGGWVVKKLASE